MLDAIFGALTMVFVASALVSAIEYSEQIMRDPFSQPLTAAESKMLGLNTRKGAIERINSDLSQILASFNSR